MRVPLNDLVRQYRAHAPALEDALLDVARSGWYALGPQHNAFEKEFAAALGVNHALGVANGTDALEIVLRALGAGPDDEIITAPNAGGYSTSAIVLVGATPVYADIDPSTLTLAADSVRDALSPKTKAVVITHLYGKAGDVAAVRQVLEGRDISLIEDCAQAHGARVDGAWVGSLGTAATFSFYPTKNLGAMGDGGMIVTGDPAIAERVKLLRQYGWKSKYTSVVPRSRNSRLDEMQAAVLRTKLPHLESWNARRREVVTQYAHAVKGSSALRLAHNPGPDYVGHLCILVTSKRAETQSLLDGFGVETAIHYPLLDYQQQAMKSVPHRRVPTPHSEWATQHILSLPCFPELTDDEVEHVAKSLRAVCDRVGD